MSNFADVQIKLDALNQAIADEKKQAETKLAELNQTIALRDQTIADLQAQLGGGGLNANETDKVITQLDQSIKDVPDIIP